MTEDFVAARSHLIDVAVSDLATHFDSNWTKCGFHEDARSMHLRKLRKDMRHFLTSYTGEVPKVTPSCNAESVEARVASSAEDLPENSRLLEKIKFAEQTSVARPSVMRRMSNVCEALLPRPTNIQLKVSFKRFKIANIDMFVGKHSDEIKDLLPFQRGKKVLAILDDAWEHLAHFYETYYGTAERNSLDFEPSRAVDYGAQSKANSLFDRLAERTKQAKAAFVAALYRDVIEQNREVEGLKDHYSQICANLDEALRQIDLLFELKKVGDVLQLEDFAVRESGKYFATTRKVSETITRTNQLVPVDVHFAKLEFNGRAIIRYVTAKPLDYEPCSADKELLERVFASLEQLDTANVAEFAEVCKLLDIQLVLLENTLFSSCFCLQLQSIAKQNGEECTVKRYPPVASLLSLDYSKLDYFALFWYIYDLLQMLFVRLPHDKTTSSISMLMLCSPSHVQNAVKKRCSDLNYQIAHALVSSVQIRNFFNVLQADHAIVTFLDSFSQLFNTTIDFVDYLAQARALASAAVDK